MSRNYLLIVFALVVILVIVGVVASLRRNQDVADNTTLSSPTSATSPTPPAASPANTAAAEAAEVNYDGTTFTPATLTVAKGTTVTFKNSSSGTVQPASDPHPSHTKYPGFDAEKAVAAGQSYSMTFDTAGTWGYHNHLNTRQTGTIVVQ